MDNLLLEIGSEEIPAGYILPALKVLSSTLQQRLADARIDHGDALVYGTPRRLAIIVKNVAPKQKPMKSEVTGPPASVGFDENGKPSMPAKKFAEKIGISPNKLTVKETPKGMYLCAQKTERGAATRTLLKEILPEIIVSLPFPKKMRWSDLDLEFARPIRSILALLGKTLIQFQMGNLKSGRYTFGHYFMAPGKIKIDAADAYVDALRSANVLVDMEERKKALEHDIAKVAGEIGGRILPDEELVDIVTNLVEYPVAVAGKFDEAFLEVPDEVLITAMREHQKYFTVVDQNNKLMPCFIAVNNTAANDMAVVATGHERVLRARLADARFFYQGDLDVTNDERVEKLKGVLFQAELGTMYAKIERIAKIAEYLIAASDIDLDSGTGYKDLTNSAKRAGRLCKADLVSQVVGEFPKLQGIMGRIYATFSGELSTVAAAIEEHYRPVYSGGPLPKTLVGAIIGIADKIDSICGCFSVGLKPTGASDPYALRRQGIGIIQILLDKGFTLSLSALIEESLKLFKTGHIQEIKEQIYTFLQNRMTHLLVEDGFSKDTIAAVLSVSCDNIPETWSRVRALEKLKAKPDFEPLAAAFKRVVNIIKKADAFKPGDVDQKLFLHESESALLGAYEFVQQRVEDDLEKGFFDQALVKIASLRDTVDDFFEGVMVLAEDEEVRRNRLSLLGHIAVLFGKIADFSKLST
ncbi:MAG: glycine--tRNA ligase subunit beta [Desulfobacterales bacterium]|nr:MAG: glycine--tRNA ligase subunit beta [Desulfobacterales bacterium]